MNADLQVCARDISLSAGSLPCIRGKALLGRDSGEQIARTGGLGPRQRAVKVVEDEPLLLGARQHRVELRMHGHRVHRALQSVLILRGGYRS